MTGIRSLTIGVAALTLAGCVSFATPTRPDYTGADQVDVVDAQQLVGVWRVTELNPIPEGGSQVTVIEYKPDGTVVGRIEPTGEASTPGITAFTMTGQWSVTEDVVTHSDVNMQSESESGVGALIAGMINRSTRDMGGNANVFEISENRIVMVGNDGAAMQYDRR